MRQLSYLIFLLGLIIIGWEYPILYPLKLLVVFFHESSHAIATLLTGGMVKELVINQDQGGHVISQGGNRFIILSAGYIGSLLWGVIIYMASVKSHYDKEIMAVLGISILIITLVLSRSIFSWLFGLLSGGAMLLMARYLAEKYNDFALRLIGLTSMMYAPLDIYSDTISRSYLQSDAYLLAEYTGGTTLLWGSIWIIISIVVIFYCLKWVLNKPLIE
ncbi:MAG: M50 family metallopeptidase [Methylococcales bacterium]|nr:M50 family metallopeptidase [Methylococcales bacterium]